MRCLRVAPLFLLALAVLGPVRAGKDVYPAPLLSESHP